jgi:hypothetical protein
LTSTSWRVPVVFSSAHLEQAVGVDAERDLERAMPAGMGGMPLSVKRASERQSLGQLALALQYVQLEARLVVGVSGELLRLRGRDRRVAGQDALDHAAHGLDAERERQHVEQQHLVFGSAAGQQIGLDGGAQRHHLVGIDGGERLAPEQLGHVAADERHTRRAAHQDHAVDLVRPDAGVAQGALDGAARALRERRDQRVELGARDRTRVAAAARALDLGLHLVALGERVLDRLGRLDHVAHQGGIRGLARVHAQLREQALGQRAVDVIPTQLAVAPVERTWNTPSSSERIVTSKVPPPRS